ncbi:phage terminase small subunit [Cohnella silvisoli]|uniref:Phage terminase small subunit n=1 Tax=Cohnella silvisoli TaxID=2873699 RepID=A0ABV1L367_9BACL|nr:phage terminase small subunit [Cohnella silvisoli]MCD9026036.1 hypothetical protein [Cohnella silvisoli]
MSRKQSPIQKKAFKIWCESGRPRSSKAIAEALGVSSELVRKWKSYYTWEDQPDPRPGAPRGNRNAKGNKGGDGGPLGNAKAVTHGLFRKILPDDDETREIFDATENMSPLDMLWYQIRITWTNIMRAQKIQYVKDKNEIIKELKKQKFEVHSKGRGKDKELVPVEIEKEYEFQFAWDVQATGLKSQAAASTALARMFKQYDEMLRTLPPEEIREEHRSRIEILKAEVVKVKAEAKTINDEAGQGPVIIRNDIRE